MIKYIAPIGFTALALGVTLGGCRTGGGGDNNPCAVLDLSTYCPSTDGCYDLQTNERNCGACDNVCQGISYCQEGQCTPGCRDPLATFCDNGSGLPSEVCVFVNESLDNCGACGNVCPVVTGTNGLRTCRNGQCLTTCSQVIGREGPNVIICDGNCVDTDTSGNNCGACGNVCPGTSACVNGVCVDACAPPATQCPGGTCTNLQTDPSNCGACGNICTKGKDCRNGVCQP